MQKKVAFEMQKIVVFEMQKRWHLKCKKSHLPSLDETSPTTLPPIMPPMQKMATTKDQMKVTEVSQAVFRDSHSSRASLPSCEKREFFTGMCFSSNSHFPDSILRFIFDMGTWKNF